MNIDKILIKNLKIYINHYFNISEYNKIHISNKHKYKYSILIIKNDSYFTIYVNKYDLIKYIRKLKLKNINF